MAILEGTIRFTGKLGNISFYRLPGSDKIIMRASGGPSKQKIMNSPRFARTRENISEFSACSACSNKIRMTLRKAVPGIHIPCHNKLISALKQIVESDNTSPRGKRSIRFSNHASLLTGFELVPALPFFEILAYTPSVFSDEEGNKALIRLQRFNPATHLFNRHNYRNMRFICISLLLPDFVYSADEKGYAWENGAPPGVLTTYGEWLPCENQNLDIILQTPLPVVSGVPGNNVTTLLILGLEFGMMDEAGISPVWKTFRGKVIIAR